MRRIAIGLACAALVVVFASSCRDQQLLETTSCLDRFADVASSPFGRDKLADAIRIANQILDEGAIYRITPGWTSSAVVDRDGARQTFPVHAVAVDPSGRYSLAFVPRGSDCILVDTSVALAAVDRLVGSEGVRDDSFPQEVVVAFFLLHEIGHIVGRSKSKEPVDQPTANLCNALAAAPRRGKASADGNDTCTSEKASEVAADRFAVEQVKRAWHGTNGQRREQAGLVQMGLLAVGIRVIGERVAKNKSRDPGLDVFCDAGFSHPNFEMRLLLAFQLLRPDERWTLRQFLEQREGCGTAANAALAPDLLDQYKAVSTGKLLALLRKASNAQRFDLVTALADRKGKSVVAALANVATLSDVADPEAAAETRSLRAHAIGALGQLGDRSVSRLLVGKLDSASIVEQLAAVGALGALRDRVSVPSLIARADRSNHMLYLSIIDALGDIGGAEARSFLETIRRSDASQADRASKSLSKIDARSAQAGASGKDDAR